MNNRPKIATLTEKELAALLIVSFFKIGREVNLPGERLKIFLEEVYKHQGWMYADTFSDAFSRCAALELPDVENLRIYVSPMFISKLMKLYIKKCREENFIAKPAKDAASILTPENKYELFVQFIRINKCLPGNSDWVTIFEHITGLKKLALPAGWDTMPYHHKWKYAMKEVAEWAYKNFNITENLLYKNAEERRMINYEQ